MSHFVNGTFSVLRKHFSASFHKLLRITVLAVVDFYLSLMYNNKNNNKSNNNNNNSNNNNDIDNNHLQKQQGKVIEKYIVINNVLVNKYICTFFT